MTVLGGSGLIGSKLVELLRRRGHEVVSASLDSGVNTLTGEGLERAVAGALVVVDVTNSPSLDGEAALEFFERSARNIALAEKKAGVGHHVALSVVGTERLGESGYFRAKQAQEALIEASGIPYTIVHSTQFFEFLGGIVKSGNGGHVVRLSPAPIQPIASDDVVDILADVVTSKPLNAVVEVAGPEQFGLAELARRFLVEKGDSRQVVSDAGARYFGAVLDERTLIPGPNPRLGPTTFETWFNTVQSRA